MKIEKLTDNKIRIILKKEDFKDKSLDVKQLLLTTPESQSLFLEILNKAKKEVNFDTDGHKLLIETSFQYDDIFIFTITKYIECAKTLTNTSKKFISVKKRLQIPNSSYFIYSFSSFEDFCEFCNYLSNNNNFSFRGLFKTSILYNYNNTYFLVIDGINTSHKCLNYFHSSLAEFASIITFSANFKSKLLEYGRVVMKNNAINTGIKYFS